MGLDPQFEEMSKEVLAETLCKFYPSAQQKPTNDSEDPKSYAFKQFLQNG